MSERTLASLPPRPARARATRGGSLASIVAAPPRVAYEPIGHSEAWEIHDGKVYWGTIHCVRSAELVR